MRLLKFRPLPVFLLFLFGAVRSSGQTAISGTVTVPSVAYPTIAAAVSALNASGIGSGGVTVNIAAGYSETLSAPLSLTATGTAANPIIFQKSGTGADPLVVAYSGGTGTPATAVQDGIWSLVGSDWVTINGIDLLDNNTANPATMEYGFGLFKASGINGCQNNIIKNCTVTLNRINNAAGTAPMTDGSAGILMTNATITAQTTAVAVTALSGGNSNNKFYGNTVQNCNIGIALNGYTDVAPYSYVDIGNDIGGSNVTTGNTIINFGGGGSVSASAGIQTSAQYNLNISYNALNNNNGNGVSHAAALRGIYTGTAVNAVTTVSNNAVTLSSGGATNQVSCIENTAGSGNTVGITANTIQNCTGNLTTSGVWYGITNSAAAGILAISGNIFTNNSTKATTGPVYLINNSGAITTGITISGNSLSHTFNGAAAFSGDMYGIRSSSGSTTASSSINANNFSDYRYTNGGTGNAFFINNANASQNLTINGNTWTGLNLNHAGTEYLIYNSASTLNSLSASNNSISGGFTRTAAAGSMYCYYAAVSSPNTCTQTISNNNFSGITAATTGTGYFNGIICSDGTSTSSPKRIISGNTISNITYAGTTGMYGLQIYGFGDGGTATGSAVYNNTLSGITVAGNAYITYLYGIVSTSPSSALSANFYGNNFNNTITTGTNANVTGIYAGMSGGAVNFYKNKLYGLSTNSTNNVATGIYLSANAAYNLTNNLIGGLTAPNTSFSNGVVGINVSNSSPDTVSNNTVYLNAAGTGTTFGSSALYLANNSAALTARNNIFVNTSAHGSGGGFTAAFRSISLPSTAAYTILSNNNLFYAGAPGAANLIYGEGSSTAAINGQQTLAAYKSYIGGVRDNNSVSENPNFVSTNGTLATYLHINPAVPTSIESGGVSIAGVTDDFDGDIRQGAPGYTGSGSAPDIGADEFSGLAAMPAISNVSITPAGNRCTAASRTITATVTPGSSGLTTVTLTYTFNAGTPVTLAMTGGNLTITSTWSAIIPVAVPANAVVTWYITATNAAGSRTYTGTPYQDAALAGTTAMLTATASTACPGTPVGLSVVPGSGYPVTSYDVASVPYRLVPTPSSGVTTLATGGNAVTTLTAGTLDDGYWTISLPFTFNLYGIGYTSASIDVNGLMMFGAPGAVYPQGAWPYNQGFTGGFAPLYGDLYAINSGTINYFVTGNAPNRVLVINWTGVSYYGLTTDTASFQAKLYESSSIFESHITRTSAGNPHLTGVQNQAATAATQPPGRTYGNWTVTTPEAWRFTPHFNNIASYAYTPVGGTSGLTTAASGTSNPTVSPTATTVYTVTVTDSNGCTATASDTITVGTAPAVTVSPSGNISICNNSQQTFTANTGTGLSYQWYRGANPVAGATNNTFTTGTAGSYTVVVTNTAGCSATSAPVSIVINGALGVTVTPSGPTVVCSGDVILLAGTTASGGTYQWYNNGTAIGGATSQNYYTAAAGSYTLTEVSATTGCTGTSAPTVLTLRPLPVPTIFKANNLLSTNTYVSYQWYLNSVPIPGATNRTYPLTQPGSYSVVVTDSACSNTSGKLVVQEVLGIANISGEDIILYPNPAGSTVHVKAAVPVNLSLYSVEGRLLAKEAHSTMLDISAYADGIYMMMVSDDAGRMLRLQKVTKMTR